MLAGACRFNRSIQRKQVGLLGQVINNLDDFSDVISALSQNTDNFAGRANGHVDLVQAFSGLVHGGDAALHLFAGTIGDVEQHLGSVGHALDGSDHLIDRR